MCDVCAYAFKIKVKSGAVVGDDHCRSVTLRMSEGVIREINIVPSDGRDPYNMRIPNQMDISAITFEDTPVVCGKEAEESVAVSEAVPDAEAVCAGGEVSMSDLVGCEVEFLYRNRPDPGDPHDANGHPVYVRADVLAVDPFMGTLLLAFKSGPMEAMETAWVPAGAAWYWAECVGEDENEEGDGTDGGAGE